MLRQPPPQVISAALVVEREEPKHVYKVQRPVYSIIKVPFDHKTYYNQVQNYFMSS
jgi:16S rRNA A1518/A1519 N6-dimethyltransferase RsmA/KsgA/DIM1 with predicted DNA glycosylase/AP lyase activity